MVLFLTNKVLNSVVLIDSKMAPHAHSNQKLSIKNDDGINAFASVCR